MLGGVVNAFTETEREMVAVERVNQYITDINCEPQRPSLQAAPYAWPSQGVVEFQNVILKYRYMVTDFCYGLLFSLFFVFVMYLCV